jgi:hypothetical protein
LWRAYRSGHTRQMVPHRRGIRPILPRPPGYTGRRAHTRNRRTGGNAECGITEGNCYRRDTPRRQIAIIPALRASASTGNQRRTQPTSASKRSSTCRLALTFAQSMYEEHRMLLDARVRFADRHPADSDFFRLDDCLCTPDDAMEHLLNFGLSGIEAQEYLNSLEVEEC